MSRASKSSEIIATEGPVPPVDDAMEGKLPEEIPFLRAFLRRLVVGCPDLDLDDLQQQTMDRALRYRETYDAKKSLRPWLQTIGFRVFLDARDASQRGPFMMREGEEPEVMGITAEASARQQELLRVLRTLPKPQGEVLERFYLREESVQEIAEALDIAQGTVKSHLHRGRKRLAEEQRMEAWL
ncbi:MAG: RNA polymerase sigma factor [Planctomycetota bacterium]